LILVTGGTGYVGGHLVRALEAAGHRVRCLARRPESLRSRVQERTEVMGGDVLDFESLGPAMRGVHTAYYLVHSMDSASDFRDADRQAAQNFAMAAARAGVRRMIYLGALGSDTDDLSAHLRSRQEVGDVLRASGPPVIEFRASIIIGSGSLSFEMIRALVERLPVMITPRWVTVKAQPIGILDVLDYLVAALNLPEEECRIFEIGGADPVSYGEIMKEYARQRGLRRRMIPVPVLTPWLSSLWLGLVTPLYSKVGRILIESIRHPTVVRDPSALDAFPVRPKGIRASIRDALCQEEEEFSSARWSEILSRIVLPTNRHGVRIGNLLIDTRTVSVPVPPAKAFAPIQRIGGATGWYYGNWLWVLRGYLDVMIGGVGMSRGRRDPVRIQLGDTIDVWRVEGFEPDRRLRLWAGMKLPGRAWLEFEVLPEGSGSRIRQTAVYDPVGLPGILYWYLLHPAHAYVFAGMIRQIAAAALRG